MACLRPAHDTSGALPGDISYAQGFTYGWDQYWTNQEPHLSGIPYAAQIG